MIAGFPTAREAGQGRGMTMLQSRPNRSILAGVMPGATLRPRTLSHLSHPLKQTTEN